MFPQQQTIQAELVSLINQSSSTEFTTADIRVGLVSPSNLEKVNARAVAISPTYYGEYPINYTRLALDRYFNGEEPFLPLSEGTTYADVVRTLAATYSLDFFPRDIVDPNRQVAFDEHHSANITLHAATTCLRWYGSLNVHLGVTLWPTVRTVTLGYPDSQTGDTPTATMTSYGKDFSYYNKILSSKGINPVTSLEAQELSQVFVGTNTDIVIEALTGATVVSNGPTTDNPLGNPKYGHLLVLLSSSGVLPGHFYLHYNIPEL